MAHGKHASSRMTKRKKESLQYSERVREKQAFISPIFGVPTQANTPLSLQYSEAINRIMAFISPIFGALFEHECLYLSNIRR
jgi:hypothetical protein